MVKSLERRLQVWQALSMLAVVAGLGTFLYLRIERGIIQQIDTELEAAGFRAAAELRAVPADRFAAGDFGLPELQIERRLLPPPRRGNERLPPPPRIQDDRRERPEENLYFIVWDRAGRPLRATDNAPHVPPEELPPPVEQDTALVRRVRDRREAFVPGPYGSTLLVGRSIRSEMAQIVLWRGILTASGAVAVAIGTFGGAWLVRRALRPLQSMSSTAANISANNLKARIATERLDTELAELAHTLNDAFDRLERDFDKQARFTADASHELRTPLTIILGHLDLALKQPDLCAATRTSLEACLRSARRLRSLTEQLLLLAKADAGKLPIQQQSFDLTGAIDECVELLSPLARRHGVKVTASLQPVEISGDPALLSQVAVNLISNAIVHNRPGGTANVVLEQQGEEAILRVADTGPGLPEDARARIFERFYRADEDRGRDGGGSGLGLAITRAIVDLHGGDIRLESRTGEGTELIVRLPRAAANSAAGHETPVPATREGE